MNGILKSEFGLDGGFGSNSLAVEAVGRAIHTYNTMRPHASCNYLTLEQAHQQEGTLKSKWKKKKRTMNQQNKSSQLRPWRCRFSKAWAGCVVRPKESRP